MISARGGGGDAGRRGGGLFAAVATGSGVLWWWIAHVLEAGGIGSGYLVIDLPAAAVTGAVVGYTSLPLYGSRGPLHLLWLAPVSLYLAAALYVLLANVTDLLVLGPEVIGRSWGRGSGTTVHYESGAMVVEKVLATWWGLTFTGLVVGLTVPAALNHGLLRMIARMR